MHDEFLHWYTIIYLGIMPWICLWIQLLIEVLHFNTFPFKFGF